MFPYRFEADRPPEPVPQSTPSPVQTVYPPRPEPAAVPAPPTHPGRGRRGATALVALALVGSTIGGGAVGAVASTQWLAPRQAATTYGSGQPISTAAPPSTTAGAVFAKVNPAVVQLVVSGRESSSPFSGGAGSGFVVDARGLILTNNHVVEGARAITVRFSNGATREGQVLGTDRGNDLALVKVDLPPDVPVAPLGDSDRVQVGETAIAIGSPFGLSGSLTQGIVSATGRTWSPGSGRARRNLLQTDTPLNPGNSGGPLLNANGEVIGVNSMIESPVRGSVGVGFAVPINLAKRLMPQLEAGAKLEPVWLGISGQELDPTIARDQGLSIQSGVLILSVVPNSPAAQAGLRGGQGANERIPRGGDVITALDGSPIKDMTQLTDALAGKQPGNTVRLTIVRNGQEQQLDVTLRAWPTETP